MKPLREEELLKIEQLHSIYSNEIPNFINELENCIELQRLKGVGQNCGDDYLNKKMRTFEFNYSRYHHSVGVALIIWHFTKNIEMSLSGLFHDISTPTFAHVVDFLNNDAENQTSTENGTETIIAESTEIQKLLKKYNLKNSDVSNYSLYPIADNKSPKLSADRLEYSLYMGVSRNIISIGEASEIFKDIIIAKNKDNEDEMCFKTKDIAVKFAKLSLENGKFMSGGISNLSNKLLADILQIAIQRKIIQEDELLTASEEEIIKKINSSSEEKLKKIWKIYQEFDKVYESKDIEETKGKYSINIKVKRRYIDPLCIQGNKTIRASLLDEELAGNIKDFTNKKTPVYYSIDFNER